MNATEKFQVSVIIPVYNAEKYIRKAVESAVSLKDVGEVLLIEDHSPDNALQICRELEKEFSKVHLYRHPNGENKGAGASRNLGLVKSSCDYVAFLDADDWYVPNRFEEAGRLFKDPKIDGVYEPVGTFFYDAEGTVLGKTLKKEEGDEVITYLHDPVSPDNLFYTLISPKNGSPHTNGITLRKSLIEKVGYFSESLKLHQDTEFWIRCAYYGHLSAPENPKIVAVRGVHQGNRIKSSNYDSRSKLYKAIFDRFKDKELTLREKLLIFKNIVFYHPERRKRDSSSFAKYSELFLLAIEHASVFRSKTDVRRKKYKQG